MIIPFFIPHAGCPHQCVFCSQQNITGHIKPVEPDLIQQTINEYLKTSTSKGPAQVAFYGGSFTALALAIQRSYLEAARPFIASGRIEGIRLSTRPDCISRDVLALLQDYHVKTVELGAQSMDDRVLTLSGRGHTAADTVQAVTMLRKFRFSVGLQLMPGLPGDSQTSFSETVTQTIALKPDFVRIYPALVIKGTPLVELFASGRYKPLTLDESVSLCKNALLAFENAGIDVIRIGLQPTEELEKHGTILAGPYHPAFRQVVESAILLDWMKALLEKAQRGGAEATFFVSPGDLSAAIGQKRSNIESLKKQFALQTIHIRADQAIPRRTVKLVTEG